MSRSQVPLCSRGPSRFAGFALAGFVSLGLAACSDSARFDSSPYASNRSAPQQDVTGSIAPRPAPTRTVTSQPLPAPSRPATMAASGGGNGYSGGGQALGAYRPDTRADVTGSISSPRPVQPSGRWTWDGGSAVMVGQNDTLEGIARKHGVPASAIMQVNNLSSPSAMRPGQRLIIPRYVSGSAPQTVAAHVPQPVQSAPAAGGNVHVVVAGDTLISLARRHNMSLSSLAKANGISPFTKLNIGDRVTIPGGAHRTTVAARPAPAQAPMAAQQPQTVAKPRIAAADTVASVPSQTVRLAKEEAPPAPETSIKSAEPAGGIPSFRWPVRGRIISSFGTKSNGAQNDGINLAVPEGTPVKAADDGVVAYAGNELKGYGNLVLVRHANGYVSAYANASEILVKRGDSVKRGQDIARAGQTGNVTSPQLHFEIRKGSTPVDPTKYLSGV